MAVNVGSAVGYLDLDINGFAKGLKTAQTEAKLASANLNTTLSTGMKTAGSKMAGIGTALSLAVTMPLVGLAGLGLKVATDFEASMSSVKAITNSTEDEFEALRQKAIELGASTAFSSKEVADAMVDMAKAGWAWDQIISGMPGILGAAAASGENLATVSTIIVDALTTFGEAASESGRYADVLTQAANSGTIGILDLGETLKYAGPLASSMGFSLEDATTSIVAMSKSGIKGSQAGTALRTMFANLTSPTDSAAAAIKSMELEVTNSDGTFRSMDSIINDMRGSFVNMTAKQKVATAAAISGKTGMAGLLSVMNMTQEEYDELGISMDKSSGIAESTAKVMQDNLKMQVEQLTGSLESLAIKLGEKVIPFLTDTAEKAADLVEMFISADDATFNTGVKLAGMVAAAGPALLIFGKLTSSVGKVSGIFGSAASGIGAAGSLIAGNISTMGTNVSSGLTGLASSAKGHFGDISRTIVDMKNPIGYAWADIGVKGEMFKDGIGSMVDGVNSKIPALGKGFELMNSGLKTSMNTGMGLATKTTESIAALVKFSMSLIGPAAIAGLALVGLGLVYQQFGPEIDKFINLAIEKGPGIVKGFVDGIVSKIPDLISTGTMLLGKFVDVIATMLPVIVQSGTDLVQSLVSGIGSNSSSLIEMAITLVNTLMKTFITTLPQFVMMGMNLLGDLVKGLLSNLPYLMSSAQNMLTLFIATVQSYMPLIIQKGIGIILSLVTGLFEALPGLLAMGVQLINGLVDTITNNLPMILNGGIMIVISLMQGLIQALPGIMASAGEIIKSLITGLVNNLPLILSSGLTLVVYLVKGLIGAFPMLAQAGWELIKTIVSSMLGAIPKMFGAVFDTLKDIGGKIWGWLTGKNQEGADATEKALVDMSTGIEGALGDTANFADSTTSGMADDITANMTGAQQSASNSVDLMSSDFASNIDAMQANSVAGFNSMATTTDGAFDDIMSSVSSGMSTSSNSMSSGFDTMNSETRSMFNGIAGLSSSGMTTYTNNMKTGATKAERAAIDMRRNVYGSVNGMYSTMNSSGKNAGDGFYSGLSSQKSRILELAGTIARGVTGRINKTLDINSPSRELGWSGKMAMLGFKNPLEDGVKDVKKISESLAMAAIPDLKNVAKGFKLDPFSGMDPASLAGSRFAFEQSQRVTYEANANKFDYEMMGKVFMDALRKEPLIALTYLDGKKVSIAVDKNMGLESLKGERYAAQW